MAMMGSSVPGIMDYGAWIRQKNGYANDAQGNAPIQGQHPFTNSPNELGWDKYLQESGMGAAIAGLQSPTPVKASPPEASAPFIDPNQATLDANKAFWAQHDATQQQQVAAGHPATGIETPQVTPPIAGLNAAVSASTNATTTPQPQAQHPQPQPQRLGSSTSAPGRFRQQRPQMQPPAPVMGLQGSQPSYGAVIPQYTNKSLY